MDLGVDSIVEKLVIYNRLDCCAFKLQYLVRGCARLQVAGGHPWHARCWPEACVLPPSCTQVVRLGDSQPAPAAPGAVLTTNRVCGMFPGFVSGIPDVQASGDGLQECGGPGQG